MNRRVARVIWLVGMISYAAIQARGSFAQEQAFTGKTIRLIVGLAPGGGFDTYSRAIARHMGKHIPGNPAIIVDNMPGAASLVSANYLYKVARSDGLTIGNFVGGIALHELFGKPGIEFQATRFEYLGVPAQDNFIIAVAKSTGITSVEKWIASGTTLKFGGVSPGGGTDDLPKVVKAVLGLPLQLVTGYKGTGPIRLAFNSGEVQGISNSIESFNATWTSEMEKGEVVLILQQTVKPHPSLPNVPMALDLAKTEEGKRLIRVQATINGVTNRLYALPPGTPKPLVQTLRRAFLTTLKDPDFLADAKKARLDIDPIDGESIAHEVQGLFNLDRSLVKKLQEILN
jgi:tripartite-type tricarboxylate transporter receptor subunit TctC